jgi:catechol 2,3-dioxygenase-like lactoylglutathione lyase family enzyme
MGVYNPLGIRGVCHFSIPVKDMERSLSFYEEVLGARVYEDEIGEYRFGFSDEDKARGRSPHVFIEIAGARVELLGLDPEGKPPIGTHHAFAIGPNDVHVIEGHLEEHGIPYNGPVTHGGTAAVSIYFSDPDGNALEFCCWDGYQKLDQIPLMQQAPRRDTSIDWDPATRRAVPKASK